MSRSRGALLLVKRCNQSTQAEIAKSLSVSRVAVVTWCSGQRRPGTKKLRNRIERVLQIPAASWDEQVAPPPRRSDGASTPFVMGTKASAVERMAHELLVELRAGESTTPVERSRILANVTQTLRSLHQLADERELAALLLRLPMWKRIETVIEEALHRFPEAAGAMAVALRELHQEGEAACSPR